MFQRPQTVIYRVLVLDLAQIPEKPKPEASIKHDFFFFTRKGNPGASQVRAQGSNRAVDGPIQSDGLVER